MYFKNVGADRALPSREDEFRLLFEGMLEGYAHCRIVYDDHDVPVDFEYLEVNRAFGRLTGLNGVEGQRVSKVIPGLLETNPELLEAYDRVAATGVPIEFDVDIIPLGLHLHVSVYGPEPGHFVAVFENVTRYVDAERALDQSERRLAHAENVGQLGHWSWEQGPDLLHWSDEMFRIFGVDQSDYVPTRESMDSKVHPDDRGTRTAAIDAVLAGRPFHEFKFRIPLPAGDRIVLATGMEPMRDSQRAIVGVSSTSLDITDLALCMRTEEELRSVNEDLEDRVELLTEELEAALAAKGDFFAAMSHELRTPLNSVIGFSSVLQQGLAGDLAPEQLRQVRMIHTSGKEMLELVDHLLGLSRMRRRGDHDAWIEFPVTAAIEDAIEAVAALNALEVTVVDASDVGSVRSDRARLSQLLINLMGRATRSSEEGVVTLRVSREGDEVVFDIAGTSAGASCADDPGALDEVAQAVELGRATTAGTDLDLSASKHMAEELGGSITRPGAQGADSMFTLRLPDGLVSAD